MSELICFQFPLAGSENEAAIQSWRDRQKQAFQFPLAGSGEVLRPVKGCPGTDPSFNSLLRDQNLPFPDTKDNVLVLLKILAFNSLLRDQLSEVRQTVRRPGYGAFNSLSRDHHLLVRYDLVTPRNYFQFPLSGSLDCWQKVLPNSTNFQFPLSGSLIWVGISANLFLMKLSIPSLGITIREFDTHKL